MSGEVVETDLKNMYDRAIEDVKKAEALLRTEESQKTAADRFIKLAKRFFDIYKLFTDTFQISLNVVAAKSMLLFVRACFIVSQKLMSADWMKMREKPKSYIRVITLPKRAVHKVYKRTIKSALYLYNHHEEEYKKLGFAKLDTLSTKRDYTQELQTVAAGLKEIGSKLIGLFLASSLLSAKQQKQDSGLDLPDAKDLGFETAVQDLETSHAIVLAYYRAIIDQNQRAESLEEDEEESLSIIDCLQPLMERFDMEVRRNVVSQIDETKRSKTMFVDLTDALSDLKKVTKHIALLDKATD